MSKPYQLDFPEFGNHEIGYIGVASFSSNIPFEVKRVFWTYQTPENILRGRHAHHNTEQVLLALTGRIVVLTEMPDGDIQTFVLDKPTLGVYIPIYCWHTMQFSQNAILMVLASTIYDEADYIREYEKFKLNSTN